MKGKGIFSVIFLILIIIINSEVNLDEIKKKKKAVRKQIYAMRKKYTDKQVEDESKIVTSKVVELEEFKSHNHILAYADYNHEVSTKYIIEEAWKLGKTVAVPKVVGKHMQFHIITDFNQLQPGYFNIPEPISGEIVDWEDALMIMPGVAFDYNNNRVGYGGGFYDRYLEKHPNLCTLALGFHFQMFDNVPTEPNDIKPKIVATEKEVIRNN